MSFALSCLCGGIHIEAHTYFGSCSLCVRVYVCDCEQGTQDRGRGVMWEGLPSLSLVARPPYKYARTRTHTHNIHTLTSAHRTRHSHRGRGGLLLPPSLTWLSVSLCVCACVCVYV